MTILRTILLCASLPALLSAQDPGPIEWKTLQGAPNIAVSLRGSYLFASLNDWRQQFSPLPPAMLTGIGVEATYDPGTFFMVGAGYEYFFGQKVKDNLVGVEDQVTAGFLYGSLRGGGYLDERKALYLFGGADIGSLHANETAKLYGVEHEASGSTLAVRPKAGILVFINPTLSSTAEIGYFAGKVTGAKFASTVVASTYDLSGLYLGLTVNYHLPL
jgi:hypothetical protein